MDDDMSLTDLKPTPHVTVGNMLSILATLGAMAVVIWQVGTTYGILSAHMDELYRRVEKADADRKDGDRATAADVRAMQRRLDEIVRYFQMPKQGDAIEPPALPLWQDGGIYGPIDVTGQHG